MMSKMSFTKEEILNQYDEHAGECALPILDNDYAYLVDRRLAKDELRRQASANISVSLSLEEWKHSDFAVDKLPSHNETFQTIADVPVSGNSSLYKLTLAPDTH
jgi:hypothetical protein